jgi:hypothetical protein
MQIAVHTIWSVYARVMISETIIVFCINYPSFTLLFVVFHTSPRFSFSFEILIKAKLIHHYVNGYTYRIGPRSKCFLTIYYFSVLIIFLNVNIWN